MIKKYSFFELISEYIIEIPIIQRDYAQGRNISNIEYIREKFVKNLVESIRLKTAMHLGFIYGKIEGKDKLQRMQLHKDAVEKLLGTVTQYANQFNIQVSSTIESENLITANSLRLIPLDGQQRLTTLFLLHWYIHIRQNSTTKQWTTNFKYNNRKSALAFFSELSKEDNISKIRKDFIENPSLDIAEKLSKYTWFLSKWRYDATVSGALVMLQQINTEFLKYQDTDFYSIDLEKLDLSFDFLDLDELNQSDELYIKMNERGKQLTDFEHFKAWLQNFTEKKYVIPAQSEFLKQFWVKIDTVWLNLFWKKIDIDYTALDDFYFNYLKTMAVTYHMATFDSKEIPEFLKSLLQDIRNTDSYEQSKVKYIPLNQFTFLIEEDDKEPYLFELFSFKALQFISHSFDFLVNIDNQGITTSINEIIDKPFVFKKLTNSYLQKNQFTLNLWDHTMYYTILKYFERSTEVDVKQLQDWLRISRNIIYNTYIQSPETLYNALHSIDDLFKDYYADSVLLSSIIVQDKFELKFFNQNQIEEEKVKAKLIAQQEWAKLIQKAENHSYFYGQILFIINISRDNSNENSLATFKSYSKVLSKLFEIVSKDFLLQRALLSIKDYVIKVNSNWSFCKTETDSLRSRNENWRRVFADTDKLKIIKVLVEEIIKKKNDPFDLESILLDIIKSHNYTIDQWEYYFVETPYPLEQCKQLEIRWKDNQDVRLLPEKTIIGYHLELRTIYLLKYLYKKLEKIEPFEKIEFLWEKGTSGRPGISMTGFKRKGKNYKLDIRYSFSNNIYEFCFYHHADIIENRSAHKKVADIAGYTYDRNFRHYFKEIHYDNIVVEVKTLCDNLKKIV